MTKQSTISLPSVFEQYRTYVEEELMFDASHSEVLGFVDFAVAFFQVPSPTAEEFLRAQA